MRTVRPPAPSVPEPPKPRKIQIGIREEELLAFLTGQRRLQLPADARLVSISWGVQDDEDGRPQSIRWLSIESSQFPEVTFRIPRVLAAEFTLANEAAPERKRIPAQRELLRKCAADRVGHK